MKEQIVDEEIRLILYYRNDEAALPWYQDADVCKQVDDRDTPYDLELLHRMYDYLCTHGDCYYIEYCGTLVGDISLRDSGELAIVVCKEYQNRHIGRRCIRAMDVFALPNGTLSRLRALNGPFRESLCCMCCAFASMLALPNRTFRRPGTRGSRLCCGGTV